MRSRVLVVLVCALMLLISVPPLSASQDNTCSIVHVGSLLVPTGTTSPPWPLTLMPLQIGDIYFHVAFLEPVGTGKFYLTPSGGASHFGTALPDFRIAFVRSDTIIWQSTSPAPITANVPSNVDEILIWMPFGPDSPVNPDGNPFGAEFTYGDSCQGPPSWYP